jgi:hypothetical protein
MICCHILVKDIKEEFAHCHCSTLYECNRTEAVYNSKFSHHFRIVSEAHSVSAAG